MNRGWARTLALASLLPLAATLGCEALTARPFAGTVMQLTITGVTPATIPAGKHLELWARTQYDDIVRVPAYYDLANGKSAFGLMIRQAISLNDPCMLDVYYFHKGAGNLLTSPAAYPPSVTVAGVTQTDAEQAQQVIDRINQLTVASASGVPLLAVLPFDPTPPPSIPASTPPDQRLEICNAYKDNGTTGFATGADLTYIANPYQITGPLHGNVYGFANYSSVTPPANYDGYRLDSPLNLKGVQEIFFTVEGDTVDPLNRGPLFLISKRTPGGADVVHFELSSPDPMVNVSGTAALLVDLDEDPVQF